jgi:hypothetical protein
LDRTLTFKSHLEEAAKKVSSRVKFVRKLAGRKWGSNAQTLRTASLALVYSSTEYCAPVWLNSAHVHRLDVQLNNVMRLITGTVKLYGTLIAPCVKQYCTAQTMTRSRTFLGIEE